MLVGIPANMQACCCTPRGTEQVRAAHPGGGGGGADSGSADRTWEGKGREVERGREEEKGKEVEKGREVKKGWERISGTQCEYLKQKRASFNYYIYYFIYYTFVN